MNESENRVSRRSLLSGAGAGAAALALGTVSFSSSQAYARQKWDHKTDVVCIGGGAAAMTAAVTATGEGSAAILVEKGAVIGGTTAKSGAVYWIPNHFSLREQGIDDNKEDCMKYMCRFSYPERYTPNSPTLGLDPEAYALLEAFYDNGSIAIDRLAESGALDSMQWTIWGSDSLAPDYFDHAPENKVPSGRSMGPRAADGSLGRGTDMIAQYEAFLNEHGMPILTDHKVVRIVLNAKGEAIGVEAESEGEIVTIRARKAVIFGTGGYSHNKEFVRLHQRNHVYGSCASGLSTGDFISIGGAAGARMGGMGGAWRGQVLVEQCLENSQLTACVFYPPGDSMFQVNRYGNRAVNEKRNYNDRTEVHFHYDPTAEEFSNHLMFMIFDRRTKEAFAGNYPLSKPGSTSPYIIEGETLADLSENLRVRLKNIAPHTGNLTLDDRFTENLEQTFNNFNQYAREGVDPEFGRGRQAYDREWSGLFSLMNPKTSWPVNDMPNSTMYPLEGKGPYFAFILGAGTLDTNGGPVINARGQVIGASGDPIPGLYGAGNCIASPSREAYFGAGGTIGLALTFGYIAGVNASKEPKKESKG